MDVIMPQLGETVEEGTVAVWHKKEGDRVAIDELLVEIETDKVATEVPSLVAGTLSKILVEAGETVKVGTPLAIIDRGDLSRVAAAPKPAGVPVPPTPSAKAAAPVAQRPTAPTHRDGHGAPLSPAVRKLLAEHGVDIARIRGTGRDGRVKRDDVLSHLEKHHAAPTTTRGEAETVRFSPLRKRIAAHMVGCK